MSPIRRLSFPSATAARRTSFPWALALAALVGCSGGGSEPTTGSWALTGLMANGRAYHTATVLPSGNVLVTGGGSGATGTSVEIYDWNAATWQAADPMTGAARAGHEAVLLDGEVLVIGGRHVPDGGEAVVDRTTLRYDLGTGHWSSGPDMASPRAFFTATLLGTGKVLVVGGVTNASSSAVATAELYDPETNTWSSAGSMAAARWGHRAVVLPSGDVLVVGGASSGNPATMTRTAEIYDVDTNTWSSAADLPFATLVPAAAPLASGDVLVAGGWGVHRAAVYSATGGTWTEVAAPRRPHDSGDAAVLPSGMVLVAGGPVSGSGTESSEVFDPVSGTWTLTGRQVARHGEGPRLSILQDGRVLATGGNPPTDSSIRVAEIFTEQAPAD